MVDVFLRSVPSDTNPNDARLYDPTVADSAGGSINGVLSQTLGSFTQSATGALLIKGQASQAIGAFTQVATGRLLIKGQASQTIGAFAQASTGTLWVKAQFNQALGAFTQTGTATLLIKGQFGQTLGAFTQVSTGTQGTAVNGAAAQTLAAFVQSASGTLTTPSVQTGGKSGGIDPYYYKRRNKRRSKAEDVREFISDVLGTEASEEAEQAKIAALQYLAIQNTALEAEKREALSTALREINQFYALIREQAKIAREEDEEDEMLLLFS